MSSQDHQSPKEKTIVFKLQTSGIYSYTERQDTAPSQSKFKLNLVLQNWVNIDCVYCTLSKMALKSTILVVGGMLAKQSLGLPF